MRRIITLVVLLSASCGASELTCRPVGVIDTELDFSDSSLIVHNLGGRGVDCSLAGDCQVTDPTGCNCAEYYPRANITDPPIMRFKGVGTAGNDTSHPGESFDLVVSNLTEYTPWSYQWTFVNGEFGQINMNGPHTDYSAGGNSTTTRFQFCAVLTSETDWTKTLTLDKFPLSFYDLCAPGPA